MIGMACASRHPERIARLVDAQHGGVPPAGRQDAALALAAGAQSPLGALLVRGFNAFCRGASRSAACARPLSREASGAATSRRTTRGRTASPCCASCRTSRSSRATAATTSCSEVAGRARSVPRRADADLLGRADFVFDAHSSPSGARACRTPRCSASRTRATTSWRTRRTRSSPRSHAFLARASAARP